MCFKIHHQMTSTTFFWEYYICEWSSNIILNAQNIKKQLVGKSVSARMEAQEWRRKIRWWRRKNSARVAVPTLGPFKNCNQDWRTHWRPTTRVGCQWACRSGLQRGWQIVQFISFMSKLQAIAQAVEPGITLVWREAQPVNGLAGKCSAAAIEIKTSISIEGKLLQSALLHGESNTTTLTR